MAITWTIIVVGVLLHGMQCNAGDSTSATPSNVTLTTGNINTNPTKPTNSLTTFGSTKPNTFSTQTDASITAAPTTSLEMRHATIRSTQVSATLTIQPTTEAATAQATQSSTLANQEPTTNPTSKTEIQPTTPNVSTYPTASKDSPQTSPTTVITSETNQATTNLKQIPTTITTKSGTTQLWPTPTSEVARNSTSSFTSSPGLESMGSQSVGTTKAQITTATITTRLSPGPRTDKGTSTPQKPFNDTFGLINSTEMSIIFEACEMLYQKGKGTWTKHIVSQGKTLTVTVTIDANQKINPDIYNTQKPDSGVTNNNTSQKDDANKGTIPDTLIAILASCGALVLILCCFAAYCTYHRRSYRKNQQHLTEELQTVENGYHDNPTLEVMEVQPEMQEKKPTLNGEFNDSWIVPIDNLLKEEIPDEEDTHL